MIAWHRLAAIISSVSFFYTRLAHDFKQKKILHKINWLNFWHGNCLVTSEGMV